jgi:hypothetical protein
VVLDGKHIFQPRTWNRYSFIRIFPYPEPGLQTVMARQDRQSTHRMNSERVWSGRVHQLNSSYCKVSEKLFDLLMLRHLGAISLSVYFTHSI